MNSPLRHDEVPRLYLVRHGETAWNVEGRYQGRCDSALSARGQRQADVLGERLAGLRECILVSSPLGRALATARVIGEHGGRRPLVDSRLSEIAYGVWEGLLQADVAAAWPQALRTWKQRPHRMRFPGGESLIDVRGRVDRFLADARLSSTSIIAVTHDVVVRIAVLAAAAEPLARYRSVRVSNASLTVLAATDRGWSIESRDDAGPSDHLKLTGT